MPDAKDMLDLGSFPRLSAELKDSYCDLSGDLSGDLAGRRPAFSLFGLFDELSDQRAKVKKASS